MQRVGTAAIEACASVAMACLVPDSVTFMSYWNTTDQMDSAGGLYYCPLLVMLILSNSFNI